MKGTVYKSTGSWYLVKTDDGTFYECRIKGKFRIHGIKNTNPVAVGDHVIFEMEVKTGLGVITEILERENYLIRKSVNLSKQTHILAANIDQLFLVVTLKEPTTMTTFMDRILITAEAYGIRPILVFNKIDIYNSEELLDMEHLIGLYHDIGYESIRVSAYLQQNISSLREKMKDRVSIFAGHSGVGKSSLINAVEPGLDLRTKEISQQHLQGQHTTTFAEMFDLSEGGQIIDTPGIRGFGVVDIEPEELADYFPEFFALKSSCKFNNCLHLNEPDCAVKDALEKDQLAWSRYQSYLQIMEGDDTYRSDMVEEV
ncbi:MAG TPA: ribosome small subunit-dependent GTPase A [Flavobacteriaceae bacterium]|jgi:ribosome biogenesis GTPase|nr:ribosome small subunit-dependent GTPase A [Flavobacteriaceae bacterium]